MRTRGGWIVGSMVAVAVAAPTAAGAETASWLPDPSSLPWRPTLIASGDDAVCTQFEGILVEQFARTGRANLDDSVVRLTFAPTSPDLPMATSFEGQFPDEEGIVVADFDHDGEAEVLGQHISMLSSMFVRISAIFQTQAEFDEAARLGTTFPRAIGLARGKLPEAFMENVDVAPVLFEGMPYLFERQLSRWDGEAHLASLSLIGDDGSTVPVCTIQTSPDLTDPIVLTNLPTVAALDTLLASISGRDSDACGGSGHFGAKRRIWRQTFVSEVSVAPWLFADTDLYARMATTVYPFTLRELAKWGHLSIWNWRQMHRLADALDVANTALVEHFRQNFGIEANIANELAQAFVEGLFLRSFAFTGTSDWQDSDPPLPASLQPYLAPDAPVLEPLPRLPGELSGLADTTLDLRSVMLRGWPVAEIEVLIERADGDMGHGEPIMSFAVGHPEYLETLVAAGADTDATNVFGKTALMYAAQLDEIATSSALLALGATVNAATQPYDSGDCFYVVTTARTALDYAIQSGSQEMIDLLRAHDAKTAAELAADDRP